jgi:hypothetical protein
MRKIIFFLLFIWIACNNIKAPDESYREKGQDIVKQTFGTLNATLMESMQSNGVEASIDLCNVKAYPITDSLSAMHRAEIKRMASRNRNKDNKADKQADKLIAHYTLLQESGRDLSKSDTLLMDEQGRVRYFKPIVLQPQCVSCHGAKDRDIQAAVYARILELYPDDKAVGFEAGDVRGIWSVRFEINK